MLEIDETLKLEINTKYPSAVKATNKTNHYSLEDRYIVRKLTKQIISTDQWNRKQWKEGGRPIYKEKCSMIDYTLSTVRVLYIYIYIYIECLVRSYIISSSNSAVCLWIDRTRFEREETSCSTSLKFQSFHFPQLNAASCIMWSNWLYCFMFESLGYCYWIWPECIRRRHRNALDLSTFRISIGYSYHSNWYLFKQVHY